MKLYVIRLLAEDSLGRMKSILKDAIYRYQKSAKNENVKAFDIEWISCADKFSELADKNAFKDGRILFAVEIDKSGVNIEAFKVISYLNVLGKENMVLKGAVGGIVVDGEGELYTKDMGRRLVFAANMAGCNFPGKPLTEATGNLVNFSVLASIQNVQLTEAYINSCVSLIEKIICLKIKNEEYPKILVVHASNSKTSNSLCLWSMVAKHLEGKAEVTEISIRNGQVWDCRGCKYDDCLHFGEESSCFYGGVIVEKVYPAIIKSDILVLICPNYNDSISANLMAFINRLTAVFRANDFSHKRIYAVIVSGYSGGDIVAQQIIGAINMNKNFILPGRFALIETANAPGDIMKIKGIEEKAAEFAEKILQ